MLKGLALVSSSVLALTIPQLAMAQSTSGDDTQEEGRTRSAANAPIIVTATKIATDVQDVPIAITAVTSEQLEARQLNTMSDLGNVVPNATFRKSEGVYGAGVSVTLRGQGQTDTQFSGEPAVAYYIDDVYYPFLFGSNFDLLDLDHVEVLRGPQGTLFGRNAISGAVNLVSKKPSLNETTGYIDLTVGAYDRRELRAGISLPLTNTMAVSASMVAKKRTGYMDLLDFSCQMYANGTPELAGTFPFQTERTAWAGGNEPTNCVIGHYGGEDQRAARAALYWEPAPGVEVNLSADYTRNRDESAAEAIFETDYESTYGLLADGTVDESEANQNFITAFDQFSIDGTPFRWDERFDTGDLYSTYDNFCDPFPAGTQIDGNSYYNGSLYRGGNCNASREVPLDIWGVQGKVIVGLTNEIDATAIAGYREIDTKFGAAWDGTPLNDSLIFHEDHMWYWSGEFRLTGQHGWLDWNAGVFYYDGEANETGRPQNVRLGSQRYQTVDYYPNAKAAYLNVTVRPLARLSFNGGLRRSDDKKLVNYASLTEASDPGSQDFQYSGTSTIFDLLIQNKRWDWKIGADYQITDNGIIYVSAATGYRLPTFQTRLFQVGQQEQRSPTALINYEVGGKIDFFNGRLRLNAAAFLQDYSQRPASFGGQEPRLADDGVSILPGDQTLIADGPDGSAYSDAFTNCRDYDPATDGAPNGTTVGIACITRTFNYSVSGGSKIKGFEAELTAEPIDDLIFTGSVGYTDRGSDTGRPLGFPDWTASGGVQYTFDVEPLKGAITPRLDWYFNSNIAYSTNYPEYDEGARSTFNARINYSNFEYDYDVSFGVTNLFDKEYFRQKIIFTVIGAPVNIGQPASPREWYLTVKKRF